MSEVINALLDQNHVDNQGAPQIILGQFERVGSTFYLDQLEKTALVHNEPYKMLVPPSWSIAKGYKGNLKTVDEFFDDQSVSDVDKHWLRNFTASLHYPGGQVVKETNLYLALPQFLELLPFSDVEILSRNPAGIISSFERNNLYTRWGYADVIDTVAIQLAASKPDNYNALMAMLETEGQDWPERLAWMIGLNAILLSRHVESERIKRVINYEDTLVPLGAQQEIVNERVQDSIFATNIKKSHDDFERRFTLAQLQQIYKAMGKCAAFVGAEFDVTDKILFGQLYEQYLGSKRVGELSSETSRLGAVSSATETVPVLAIDTSEVDQPSKRRLVELVEGQPLLWDYSLVTNKQMGEFLQSLNELGLDPDYNYLLQLDNMPPSRGGRIIFNHELGQYEATEAFDQYPAYWITWLVAALYAYKEGMRLPTYKEWQTVFKTIDSDKTNKDTNHSYAFDDATPTGIGTEAIPNDFFGNLRIWCSDWSNGDQVSKKVAGISWKHYDHEDYKTENERPYLTNTRVIGARLVCCAACPEPQPHSMLEVKAKLDEVISLIRSSTVVNAQDLAQLNNNISKLVQNESCRLH